jgi:hypothetical protein
METKTTDEKARALYDFVTSALTYDYDRLNNSKIDRLGAVGALNNPESALCMEYTDLFIALSRSIGIPAREINGFALTQDPNFRPTALGGRITSDILHAWPEYFSFEKQKWVQIDPTWGSTTGGVDYFDKLDTNHIVFVRKGVSAEEPLPAGAYKFDASSKGDVKITPSTTFPESASQYEVSLQNREFPAGFSVNDALIIKNSGKRSLFGGTVTFTSGLNITPTEVEIGTILPGQEALVNFKVRSPNFLGTQQAVLRARVALNDGNKEIEKGVEELVFFKPFFTLGILPVFFGGLVLVIVVLGYFFFRGELVGFKKKA